MAQLSEGLLSTHKAQGSSPALHKQGMVAHTYNPSPGKVEAGRSEALDHPPLYSEFSQPGKHRTLSLKQTKILKANEN